MERGLSIFGAGVNVEYGNPYDMMSSGGNTLTDFNVWFKRGFDWVLSSQVQVASASGTYRVFALETTISSGLSLVTPAAGETGLMVAVLVDATDDVGVTRVQLERDGAIARELTAPPWSASLDVSAGPHSLVAIAFDASGKSTRSAAVAFTAKAPQVDGGGGGSADAGFGPADGPIGGTGCGCGATDGVHGVAMLLLGWVMLRRRHPRRAS